MTRKLSISSPILASQRMQDPQRRRNVCKSRGLACSSLVWPSKRRKSKGRGLPLPGVLANRSEDYNHNGPMDIVIGQTGMVIGETAKRDRSHAGTITRVLLIASARPLASPQSSHLSLFSRPNGSLHSYKNLSRHYQGHQPLTQ
jgi:hypothetical protein